MIDRVRAKMVGADDFLAKPPAPDKIAQLLEKYIVAEDRERPRAPCPAPPYN